MFKILKFIKPIDLKIRVDKIDAEDIDLHGEYESLRTLILPSKIHEPPFYVCGADYNIHEKFYH